MRHHRNMRSQIHPAVGRDQFCHLKDLKPEGLSNRVGESKDSFDVIILGLVGVNIILMLFYFIILAIVSGDLTKGKVTRVYHIMGWN